MIKRSTGLYGKHLFFSISYDCQIDKFYTYLALWLGETKHQLKHCLYLVATFDMAITGDVQRFGSYNLVFNVYKKFVPLYAQRIEVAALQLKEVFEESSTTEALSLQSTTEATDSGAEHLVSA